MRKECSLVLVSGITFLLAFATGASAQTPAKTCDLSSAKVMDAYKEVPQPAVGGQAVPPKISRWVELRDTITVQVDKNFKDQIKTPECANKPIVLYLDDRPLADVTAYPPADPNQNILRFPLARTESSRAVWTYILGRPGWESRPTKISIGFADGYAIRSDAQLVHLWVLPHNWLTFWALLFLALLVGFFVLAHKTDVLRDSTPLPGEGERRPFSLARAQAAWWFFLILASYLFIGMATGDFSTSMTGTVIVLLGISAGTAVGSAFVDASKSNPDARQSEAVTKAALQTRIEEIDKDMQQQPAVPPAPPGTPDAVAAPNAAAPPDAAVTPSAADLAAERDERVSQLRKLNNESENFLQDILSDVNGVNFHRFQMMAWTVVLGIIFVGQVYRDLAMPQFSDTLLGLMGISAGTYLGLKIPEATAPKMT